MTMSRTTPSPPLLRAPSETPGASPRARRVTATFVGLIAGAALLAGCAVPEVASMSPNLPERPHPTASPAPSPSTATESPDLTVTAAPAAQHTVPVPPDRGDLYAGSLTRKLAAGNRTLVVDYWTEADPTTLSATAPTIVKLSAHLEDGDPEHAVKVSRFLATADDGSASTTVA